MRLKEWQSLIATALTFAYTDDTTFFLKDIISIKYMGETFDFVSCFLGLKQNLRKSEMAGIGVLKGVQVAVCGMLYRSK